MKRRRILGYIEIRKKCKQIILLGRQWHRITINVQDTFLSRRGRQTWSNLENYCRKPVQHGNELYIMMGNYGTGGTGSLGYKTTIAHRKVTVPTGIWKVIVILPVGDDDAARVITTTRIVAVDTPNNNNITSSWERIEPLYMQLKV